METLIINRSVDKNGIYLNPELLSNFKNQKVQIIIRQIDENPQNPDIMKFAGIINAQEAAELSESIDECRIETVEI